MVGVIRRWDILVHPVVTIRCFGWKVFFRALVVDHQRTFLSLLTESQVFKSPTAKVPELVGRCVELELRAKRVYESLAERFAGPEPVRAFFRTLADQEQDHAELLDLCRSEAGRGGWVRERFDPWQEAVPQVERQMQEAEAWLESLDSLPDALRLVIQIESSEINNLYLGVVAATDSAFVRKLEVFREAALEHIAYICRRIPEFDSEFAEVCQKLGEAYARTVPGM